MTMRWKAAGVCLSLVMAGQANASEPIQRLFQQWQVTCNNLNDCDVRNADQNDNIRIALQYQAGPHGRISLDITGYDSDQPEGIWVDDKLWQTTLTPYTADASHEGAGYSSDSLIKIQAFLQLITNASSLSVSDDSDEGTALAGLNDALMFIDERQGRVHNRTALAQPGEGLAGDVPLRYLWASHQRHLPPAIMVEHPQQLIKAVLTTQQQALNDAECTPEDETVAKSGVQPLDAQHALVMINCVSGAYQSSSLLFVTPRTHPEQAKALELPVPLRDEQGEQQTISWFTNSHYNPVTGLLYHMARGRGLADCGESAIWQFNGKNFELMSYRNQPICDGGEPGNWPSVWLIPGFKESR